ncbi:uncharacterized protein [Pseudorasbora parva]
MQFYLVNKNVEKTPKPSEDFTLFLAGMGRRTVKLSEDADHSEITRQLMEHYPKLRKLTGGWLLYKALGGSGQRKLMIVPPEADGYNGQYLKSSSGGGKITMFIVPLQEELDSVPLPSDAVEFQKMPKATCQNCSLTMPLQILAMHVKSCSTTELSTEDDTTSSGRSSPLPVFNGSALPKPISEGGSSTSKASSESFPVPTTAGLSSAEASTSSSTNKSSSEAACPLCLNNFPMDYLEIHASFCGESLENSKAQISDQEDVFEPFGCKIESLEDVLKSISAAVITEGEGRRFEITISRQNMLERGLVQWQRQKKSSPINKLKVTFIGEAGVDTGALSKEFLTEMIGGIEGRFFEGGAPKYSLSDLDKGHFKTIGEIMAVSLAQGGPAPNFLAHWCYRVLCSGSLEFEHLEKNDLGDGHFRDLTAQVESATESSITELTEDILSCGYLGVVSLEKKDEIIRAIILHATLKLIPILQEIRKGLQLYGLGGLMEKHPEMCQPLFVPGTETAVVDADFVISICQAEYSEKGSYREQVEVAMMNHLQDLLQELEQNDSASVVGALPMTPKTFLQWVTGQGHIPILSQDKTHFKITVQFNHNCDAEYDEHRICYPTVAACSNTIMLPAKHMSNYEDFKTVLMEGFFLGQEFLKV